MRSTALCRRALSGVRSNRLSYSPAKPQVTGCLLRPTGWAMVQVQHTSARPAADRKARLTAHLYGMMLWWNTGVRANVAGHRFAWCSAAPAQRFYSTPLEATPAVREARSQGPWQAMTGRWSHDLRPRCDAGRASGLDDDFYVRGLLAEGRYRSIGVALERDRPPPTRWPTPGRKQRIVPTRFPCLFGGG